MVLLDTNVISELRKGPRAHPGVSRFFARLDEEDIYLPVQTLGEIRCGLERIRQRGDHEQAARLETWLDGLLAVDDFGLLGNPTYAYFLQIIRGFQCKPSKFRPQFLAKGRLIFLPVCMSSTGGEPA